MSRSLTAISIPANTTVCSKDGVPYRADDDGIVHIESRHLAEMSARGYSTINATQMAAGTHHKGVPLVITVENT